MGTRTKRGNTRTKDRGRTAMPLPVLEEVELSNCDQCGEVFQRLIDGGITSCYPCRSSKSYPPAIHDTAAVSTQRTRATDGR